MTQERAEFPTKDLRRMIDLAAADAGVSVVDMLNAPMPPRLSRRIYSERVGERIADELACALGFHPVNLWPEWGRR